MQAIKHKITKWRYCYMAELGTPKRQKQEENCISTHWWHNDIGSNIYEKHSIYSLDSAVGDSLSSSSNSKNWQHNEGRAKRKWKFFLLDNDLVKAGRGKNQTSYKTVKDAHKLRQIILANRRNKLIRGLSAAVISVN